MEDSDFRHVKCLLFFHPGRQIISSCLGSFTSEFLISPEVYLYLTSGCMVFAHTHGEFVHKVRIIYVSYEVDLRELKVVHLGEEKTRGRPYCSLAIDKRFLQER